MNKHKIEMQIIYDGRKVQVWEFVSQGLNIRKSSTGKHRDGVAVVKNMKTIMCQEGGTRALQWSGNPYGNGYGVEMEWKWGTICENRMDWIGFGAECRLKTI